MTDIQPTANVAVTSQPRSRFHPGSPTRPFSVNSRRSCQLRPGAIVVNFELILSHVWVGSRGITRSRATYWIYKLLVNCVGGRKESTCYNLQLTRPGHCFNIVKRLDAWKTLDRMLLSHLPGHWYTAVPFWGRIFFPLISPFFFLKITVKKYNVRKS